MAALARARAIGSGSCADAAEVKRRAIESSAARMGELCRRQGVEERGRAGDEQLDLFVADYVGRHEIDGGTDGTQQELALERAGVEVPRERRARARHLERPDHAGIAEVPDA